MDRIFIASMVDAIEEDILALPDSPSAQQIDDIIWNLFEVMEKLTGSVYKYEVKTSRQIIRQLYEGMRMIRRLERHT